MITCLSGKSRVLTINGYAFLSAAVEKLHMGCNTKLNTKLYNTKREEVSMLGLFFSFL
mgnify:CR=1 FL=1